LCCVARLFKNSDIGLWGGPFTICLSVRIYLLLIEYYMNTLSVLLFITSVWQLLDSWSEFLIGINNMEVVFSHYKWVYDEYTAYLLKLYCATKSGGWQDTYLKKKEKIVNNRSHLGILQLTKIGAKGVLLTHLFINKLFNLRNSFIRKKTTK
jgi:hypothetical protein